MSTAKFNKLDELDRRLLKLIAKRTEDIYKDLGIKWDRMSFDMDMIACHSNGCPIDFEKLAEADNFTFNHDVAGIRNNINRDTGELDNGFIPRCTA